MCLETSYPLYFYILSANSFYHKVMFHSDFNYGIKNILNIILKADVTRPFFWESRQIGGDTFWERDERDHRGGEWWAGWPWVLSWLCVPILHCEPQDQMPDQSIVHQADIYSTSHDGIYLPRVHINKKKEISYKIDCPQTTCTPTPSSLRKAIVTRCVTNSLCVSICSFCSVWFMSKRALFY